MKSRIFLFAYSAILVMSQSTDESQVPIRFAPITMAKRVENYRLPTYPPASLRSKSEGLVVAGLLMDESGKVTGVKVVVSPDNDIKESVERALAGWTFRPALIQGIAHPTLGNILFYFWCKGTSGEIVVPGVTDKVK